MSMKKMSFSTILSSVCVQQTASVAQRLFFMLGGGEKRRRRDCENTSLGGCRMGALSLEGLKKWKPLLLKEKADQPLILSVQLINWDSCCFLTPSLPAPCQTAQNPPHKRADEKDTRLRLQTTLYVSGRDRQCMHLHFFISTSLLSPVGTPSGS